MVLRARGPKNGPKMPKITSKCNFTVSRGVLEPFGGVSDFRRFDPKVTLKQRPRGRVGVRKLGVFHAVASSLEALQLFAGFGEA